MKPNQENQKPDQTKPRPPPKDRLFVCKICGEERYWAYIEPPQCLNCGSNKLERIGG